MTDNGNSKAQDGGKGAVLRRLIRARNGARAGAGTAPALPQAITPTPARGAAIAVGRAAEDLYALPVKPLKVTPGGATLAELAELIPQPALLAVVQGAGDAVGVVALCPAAVTTLIEMQALGRVTARPLEKRRLTASDAMICTDFVDALLAELKVEIAGLDGFECYQGFHYASHLDDPRPLMLMMEDVTYRTLTMQLCFGARDTREAQIFVALPQARSVMPPAPQRSAPRHLATRPGQDVITAGSDTGRQPAPCTPDLSSTVQNAPVGLSAVLCRRRVTLAQLRALQQGGTLALPRVSLMDARLETDHGQLIAQGKLGEADGCYAIRLHDPMTALTALPTPGVQTAPSAVGPGISATATTDLAEPLHSLPQAGATPRNPDAGSTPGLTEPPMDDLALPDGFRPDPAAQHGGEIATDAPPLHSAAG